MKEPGCSSIWKTARILRRQKKATHAAAPHLDATSTAAQASSKVGAEGCAENTFLRASSEPQPRNNQSRHAKAKNSARAARNGTMPAVLRESAQRMPGQRADQINIPGSLMKSNSWYFHIRKLQSVTPPAPRCFPSTFFPVRVAHGCSDPWKRATTRTRVTHTTHVAMLMSSHGLLGTSKTGSLSNSAAVPLPAS